MTEPPTPPPPPEQPYGPGEPYQPTYPPPSGEWGAPPPPPPRPSLQLGERLGARLWRRPEPRFGVSLAAAGAALLLVGTLIWTGGYYGDGLDVHFTDSGDITTSGESRRFLGAAVFFVLAVLGYVVALRQRRGPLATAGAVAAAFGVPLAIGFVSLDIGGMFSQGSYPFNLDAVFLVSILIWAMSYLAVPGIRGRALYLALALIAIYTYIGFKSVGQDTFRTGIRNGITGGASAPDTSTLTAIALIFGVGYYAIAAVLDRRGRHGAAVAFVVAGFHATAEGVLVGTPDLKQAGTGVLLLFLGAGLAWYGGYFGRRFTTWTWSAGFVLGIVLIVDDIAPDNYTAAGITLMVIGAIVAAGAYAVSAAAREAPDVEEPVPAGQ